MKKEKAFKLATVGGTFNSLHKGHLEYLAIAFSIAKRVHIFLTTDEYAKRTKIYTPHPYEKRLLRLTTLLQKQGLLESCEIIALKSDLQLERSIIKGNYDIAVVEPAYFQLFQSFNSKRTKRQKSKFCIIYKPRSVDNLGKDISSTRLQNKIFKQNQLSA
jgi:cytidyltransferase-like protein